MQLGMSLPPRTRQHGLIAWATALAADQVHRRACREGIPATESTSSPYIAIAICDTANKIS